MMMKYRDYVACVEVDDESGVFCGHVLGINDVITFEGSDFKELKQAFADSVEDYLEFCKERGEKPNKPYSGVLTLRMSPEVHQRADIRAREAGLSLNKWLTLQVEKATNEPQVVVGQ